MPYRLNDMELKGFTVNMTPTTAEVLETYHSGLPAITQNSLGKGQAIILGYGASMMCFKPGQLAAEYNLIKNIMGTHKPFYKCENAIVYRLAAPQADHFSY